MDTCTAPEKGFDPGTGKSAALHLSLALRGKSSPLHSALCPAACISDMWLQLALIMYSKEEEGCSCFSRGGENHVSLSLALISLHPHSLFQKQS